MSKSWSCVGCGGRTTGCSGYCQGCKSKMHHAYARIRCERLLVDTAGGDWWVWSARGEVLVLGCASRVAAIQTLAGVRVNELAA